METIARPKDGDASRLAGADGPEGFLELLKHEQARFLDTFRQACSLLDRDAGQLAQIAATQGRLTRQLFDAQRSILKRRADVDAEVALIGRLADDDAASLVEAARIEAVLGDVASPRHGDPRLSTAAAGGDHRACSGGSARPEVMSLAVSVVRTTAEADSLADVIDDAFEPAEHDGVALQREFGSMLDEWWDAERHEGAAVIELAHARAAMRTHVARIEADEILMAARAQITESRPRDWSSVPPAGPAQILEIAQRADAVSVQALLDMLANSLDPRRSHFPPPQHPNSGRSDVRLERTSIDVSTDERDPGDALRYFLSGGSVPALAMQVRHVGR